MSNKSPGITVRFERTGKGFKASLRFHLRHVGTGHKPGTMVISGISDDDDPQAGAAGALKSALAIANMSLSNPAMSLLLPPGTMETIAMTKALADAAPQLAHTAVATGKSLWSHFAGGMKKLAKNLSSVDGCGAMMGGEPIMILGTVVDHRSNPGGAYQTHAPKATAGRNFANASALANLSRQAFNTPGSMVTNPNASVNPSANPYAQNPWAPFPTPNQADSPSVMSPPDLASPADAYNYDGTPSDAYEQAATNEEIDAATQTADPSATPASQTPEQNLEMMGAEEFANYFADPNAEW